ncbi:hypothetical protein MUP46_01130 [Patescibacteria group bacterium]|nr:hypothetical protein [Patescibacteria group bacterium]
MANNSDIKKLLDKVGKAHIETKNGGVTLLKNNGRYSYSINGLRVGITEKQLQSMIERLPANRVIRG